MMKPLLSLFAAAFLVSFSAAPASAASAQDASNYIESLANKALGVITNKTLAKDKKQAQLEKLFSDNVDTQWVGRFVMGRYWRTATDDQKQRYLKEYDKFLTQSYASRFTEINGGNFKITEARADADNEGEYFVSMEMKTDSASEPVLVDYRVRAYGNKYKVFDIIVEGVSMITTQRSEFSSVIGAHDVDYLITQMTSKSLSVPATPKKG